MYTFYWNIYSNTFQILNSASNIGDTIRKLISSWDAILNIFAFRKHPYNHDMHFFKAQTSARIVWLVILNNLPAFVDSPRNAVDALVWCLCEQTHLNRTANPLRVDRLCLWCGVRLALLLLNRNSFVRFAHFARTIDCRCIYRRWEGGGGGKGQRMPTPCAKRKVYILSARTVARIVASSNALSIIHSSVHPGPAYPYGFRCARTPSRVYSRKSFAQHTILR